MRYILPLVLVIVFYSSCKKDLSGCKDYTEIKGREVAADVTAITAKELLDTLAKYPQLVPYQVINGQYISQVACHVYYKDLLIFSDQYNLNKEYALKDTITSSGKILNTNLTISLTPFVSYKDAVKEAKKHVNFEYRCITYQLGLYDINRWTTPAEYRLAWKIMDSEKSYIYVIMDAVSNQVLLSDNGIRWIN